MIHRFRHSSRESEITRCSFRCERDSTESINQCSINATPSQFCVFRIGIDSVIQNDMQCRQEAKLHQDLRQERGQTEFAATPDNRWFPQQLLPLLATPLKVIQHTFQRKQRNRSLTVFTPDNTDTGCLPGFGECRCQARCLLADRSQILGRNQQAPGDVLLRFGKQMLMADIGDSQTKIQQIAVNRIKPFTRFEQHLEACAQMSHRRFAVVNKSRFRPGLGSLKES